MGLPVPVSSVARLLRGVAAALPGLGHWMLVLECASSPFPLLSHCVTPLSVEESRAALEQRVGFPQRAVPAFGRQGCRRSEKGGGEWRAWPGGATGDRSVVGSRFVRLQACGRLWSSEKFSLQRSLSDKVLGSDKVPPLSREALGLSGSFCWSSCARSVPGAAAWLVLVALVGSWAGCSKDISKSCLSLCSPR